MNEIYHAQKLSSPAKPVARQGRKATDPDLHKQDRRVTNEPGELNSYRYLQVLSIHNFFTKGFAAITRQKSIQFFMKINLFYYTVLGSYFKRY